MSEHRNICQRNLNMERHGFVRDMLDVKVLILYVAARVQRPVTVQNIYELAYQDEKLTYFDVCEAVPQLEESGHLRLLDGGVYEITESGRENGAIMEETIAFPVAQRAKAAVEKFNLQIRRDGFIRTHTDELPSGDYAVSMELRDDSGKLMSLELMAPTIRQGRRLEKIFRARAEQIYQSIMDEFLEVGEENN